MPLLSKGLNRYGTPSAHNIASIPSNNNIIVNNINDSLHSNPSLPTGTSFAQLFAVDSCDLL